jgi:dTDP-4-dehydrorhamnose reductase
MDAGLRGAPGVTMFEDEFRSALYARDAVDGLLRIARQKATGIYHLGGPERLSRYEFAVRYARFFGLDPGRVRPARQTDAGGPIFRPPDVSLDISKARRELEFNPRPAEEAFRELRGTQAG